MVAQLILAVTCLLVGGLFLGYCLSDMDAMQALAAAALIYTGMYIRNEAVKEFER